MLEKQGKDQPFMGPEPGCEISLEFTKKRINALPNEWPKLY